MALSEQLDLNSVDVKIRRIDSQIVEALVEIDYSENSVLGSVIELDNVTSINFSYRVE